MWRDWQPDVVAADLKQLAAAGLQVLRVFPLWPDFQPITQLYGGGGNPQEIRHGDKPLPTLGDWQLTDSAPRSAGAKSTSPAVGFAPYTLRYQNFGMVQV